MLGHFRRCGEEGQAARIVYLGGSITEGQGVDDKRLCWQGLLQGELERSYPRCLFQARNAGIGGTDSRFGAFRMERDVLEARPDLLFVEFAVNDYTRPAEEIRESLEAILYKLWRKVPECDVVFVLTVTGKMMEESAGREPESVQVHRQVAGQFGLPWVNVGSRLWEKMQTQGLALQDALPDGVHPNRAGYRIYFEGVWEFLQKALSGGEEKGDPARGPKKDLGAYREGYIGGHREEDPAEVPGNCLRDVQENRYTACRMVPASQALLQGFVTEHIAMCGRFGSYVSSHRPGDSLEYIFQGDKIGLFYMISCDGGIMEWSLDGGAYEALPAWDTYARTFDRGSARMLAQDLEPGEHRLRIRVARERMEESQGYFVRIGDFLI